MPGNDDPKGVWGDLYRILMTPVPPPPDLKIESLLDLLKKIPEIPSIPERGPSWWPQRPVVGPDGPIDPSR